MATEPVVFTPESVAEIVSKALAAHDEAKETAAKAAEAAKAKATKDADAVKQAAVKAAEKAAKAAKKDGEDDEEDADNPEDDAAKRLEKLNRRSAKYRNDAKHTKAELEEFKANSEKALKDAMDAQNKATDARIIKAEVKAELKAAGVIDVDDALKLLDLSALTINGDGEVSGIDALIKAAKEGKAYLFADKSNTAIAGSRVPKPGPMSAKKAADMTQAEVDAEERALMAR